MTRRGVLQGILAAGLAAALPARAQKALPADMKAAEQIDRGTRQARKRRKRPAMVIANPSVDVGNAVT